MTTPASPEPAVNPEPAVTAERGHAATDSTHVTPVEIAGRMVPTPGDVYVIAEAGVNHNGDLDLAHRLVDIAAAAGADAVKFQTFSPDKLVSSAAATTPYQRDRGGSADQRSLLEALTLPAEAWAELRDHATEAGSTFLSTPFDLDSAEMLVGLGLPALKVSSGELTNLPYLRELARLGVTLLVSTGMGTEDEVAAAVEACDGAPGLVLFHCVSAYPAPVEECNLRVIPRLTERHGIPVGWSDHTPGLTTALGAVALGAPVLEKHFTSDRTLPGPDHLASLEPEALADYVTQTKLLAAALGDGVKVRMPSEEENAVLVRRSWHAAHDLAAGAALTGADLQLLRPEGGISPAVDIRGRVLARDVSAGAPLTDDDLAR
ncbi:N-acetylneuraminate synthase [Humibacillus xanthopallidus]|uniref:N-acetylneuraminate synthase n=1 Tax=Humibacillus xanthopallidus TaxID=412689 RepID=A0A543PX68_9MICO|nr:N-acetylneuraminate synthase family protein [Humibacillus xanthopallidus]TQN48677.1 N-acetylneuraminate synthase [Humibacillus xanthopallidus]